MYGARVAVAVLALAMLALACAVMALVGFDRLMMVGAGTGLLLGFSLSALGGRRMSRALSGTERRLIAQLWGGLLIRLAMLVCGFAVFAVSGAGSPVGFALAYVVGALLAQVWQVWAVTGEPKAKPS